MSFLLYADKNQLSLNSVRELITSGSANIYKVRFQFSDDWEGMSKVACFRSGGQIISVPLDETGVCEIPWEVTDPDDAGKKLFAGVYGTRDGMVILPTVWASLGDIQPGTTLGQNTRPPAPNLWEQLLAQKMDKISGKPGQFLGFDEDGNLTALDLPQTGKDDDTDASKPEEPSGEPEEASKGEESQ